MPPVVPPVNDCHNINYDNDNCISNRGKRGFLCLFGSLDRGSTTRWFTYGKPTKMRTEQGWRTFRYHFIALYRDKRLNPNSSYGRIQTKNIGAVAK